MKVQHSRQSFLGRDSDQILDEARVAIIGLGGGGSHVAQQLAHVGLGTIVGFDPDAIDESNLNRLVGGTAADVPAETKKATIAERMIRAIRPDARPCMFPNDWREVFDVLHEADIIVGCVDLFRTRFELESLARRYLIPYIDIGMDVRRVAKNRYAIAGQVALSLPGRPCLRCMGLITDDDLERERYGAAGGRPQVVWPNGMLASAAVGLVVQLLTPWYESPGPTLLRLDGNLHTVAKDPWQERIQDRPCEHFDETELGDPFYSLEVASGASLS